MKRRNLSELDKPYDKQSAITVIMQILATIPHGLMRDFEMYSLKAKLTSTVVNF